MSTALRTRSKLVWLFALAALDASPAPAQIYGSDACVATKLAAIGSACSAVVRGGVDTSNPTKLARRFAAAEGLATALGADCSESTQSASEVGALVQDAGLQISSALTDDLDPVDEGRCAAARTKNAAGLCRALLRAEGAHIVNRGRDRDSTLKNRRIQRAWDRYTRVAARIEKRSCDGNEAGDIEAILNDFVADARWAATVSPDVSDTEFMRIDPQAQVQYQDRTLEPICSRGDPWWFYAKRGTVNKLLVFYDGGGACWNGLTCALPAHTVAASENDDPNAFSSGFGDLENPENPFRDWHIITIPYCTGDVHWGDATVEYTLGEESFTIYHRGRQNALVVEQWAREHFAAPEQVFITGASAGSYGAIVNALSLMEFVWPSADFSVLGDAGNGVVTQGFLENNLAVWGIQQNLPEWIPELDRPLGELDAADLWVFSSQTYPQHRFGTLTSAYDGSRGGQSGFYNLMITGSELGALSWWEASCEWNEVMTVLNTDISARVDNYRAFVSSGTRHTTWGSDKVYTDTTGGIPTVVSWIDAMINDTMDWTHVLTSEPGTTLPGDPMPPTPDTPPFVGGNVVCEP